ncbi:response regulator transcription factor [Varunaivibrio sulfuroxidans]|uniref:LuxR family two component transcriptional regulator n=1 Tax=Varunaivibrio sulfuroxidans TaxID=1773489 RepID=A0A4R3J5N9_9PROT|nr:response regulator [Varunaivibrio sulfuroxidans]TCS61209.1 LuxR family two component transcriptional regulator [Varunaivibrio sulfuroxidans]WES31170.1 response regulator [Varunaivibrio sulfuroxidans]
MINNAHATVFIVDDNESMRNSLCYLIESMGYKVVSFSSAHAFLEENLGVVTFEGPVCLLLDVRMPGMSGLELQEELKKCSVDIPVIFITSHGDVPSAVRALKNGAFDFIEKPFSDQILLDRIREALLEYARSQTQRERQGKTMERLQSLTARQRQVLDLVVAGKQNKEISYQLDISMKTVEMHRHHIMEKLDAHSVAEITRLMFEAGEHPPHKEG